MKIRKRPADAVVGDRQLSACVLGLAYDRFWVGSGLSGFGAVQLKAGAKRSVAAIPR